MHGCTDVYVYTKHSYSWNDVPKQYTLFVVDNNFQPRHHFPSRQSRPTNRPTDRSLRNFVISHIIHYDCHVIIWLYSIEFATAYLFFVCFHVRLFSRWLVSGCYVLLSVRRPLSFSSMNNWSMSTKWSVFLEYCSTGTMFHDTKHTDSKLIYQSLSDCARALQKLEAQSRLVEPRIRAQLSSNQRSKSLSHLLF